MHSCNEVTEFAVHPAASAISEASRASSSQVTKCNGSLDACVIFLASSTPKFTIGQPFSIDIPSFRLRSIPAAALRKSFLRVYQSEYRFHAPRGARSDSAST